MKLCINQLQLFFKINLFINILHIQNLKLYKHFFLNLYNKKKKNKTLTHTKKQKKTRKKPHTHTKNTIGQ